jgi:hypothetical protein
MYNKLTLSSKLLDYIILLDYNHKQKQEKPYPQAPSSGRHNSDERKNQLLGEDRVVCVRNGEVALVHFAQSTVCTRGSSHSWRHQWPASPTNAATYRQTSVQC